VPFMYFDTVNFMLPQVSDTSLIPGQDEKDSFSDLWIMTG
jgi:hypothetical protein